MKKSCERELASCIPSALTRLAPLATLSRLEVVQFSGGVSFGGFAISL